MNRLRIKKQHDVVISVRGIIVFSRESIKITQKFQAKLSIKQAYEKRYKEFMFVGGTRELYHYSNNVARRIQEFKNK